ncbi:peptidase inhibitor 16-like, partial [Anneissia japonica]|uniref:peptidase inhibitor 16-like n=1 Tax=Anneissia japonica TaxID=1529436 RepID=UPI0014255E01
MNVTVPKTSRGRTIENDVPPLQYLKRPNILELTDVDIAYLRKGAWNKTDMSVFTLLLVLLYMQSCSCFTDDEKQQIVDKHNNYRLNVSPSAGDMRKLVYDDTVASVAIDWVATCPTNHNPNRNNYGENMAFSTQPFDGDSLLSGIEGWYEEVGDYTYSTGACEAGKMCGHYTQVVDTRSLKVGCATNANPCSGVTYPYVFVCNYDPAGNFNGQKPYKLGSRCSLCPDETKYCEDEFCSKRTTPPPIILPLYSTRS